MQSGFKFSFIGSALALFIAVSLTVTSPASAQSRKELKQQLDQLQQQVSAIKTQMDKDSKGVNLNVMLADLTARLNGIEQQMRQLGGRLEEVEQRQRGFDAALDGLRQEMTLKMNSLGTGAEKSDQLPAKSAEKAPEADKEGQSESLAPEKGEPLKPLKPSIILPEGSDSAQYDYAFGFVRQQDFPSAETALKLFIDQKSGSKLISNAHYWLGRVYQKQAKSPLAAQEFLTVVRTHADSDKYPDALVDLAGVLVDLKVEKGQVCNILAEFDGIKAKASGFLISRADRLHNKVGCQ